MTKDNGMPLEGEGSYIGGKKYQDEQRKFAKSGKAPGKAREAADAVDGPEGEALEKARTETARGEPKAKP